MTRWRTTIAKYSLLAGMCSWLVVSFVAMLHDVVIQHVVCAEHGEVLELEAVQTSATTDAMAGPQARAAGEVLAETHGCVFDLVCLDDAVVATFAPTISEVNPPIHAELANSATPRGPPLSYAPKTGPPLSII